MKRKIELPSEDEIMLKIRTGKKMTSIDALFTGASGAQIKLNALQEAYNQGYEDARPKWLPVNEAVMCTEYLVNTRNGLEVAYFDEKGRWHHQSGSGWYLANSEPTHFQELPEQPTR